MSAPSNENLVRETATPAEIRVARDCWVAFSDDELAIDDDALASRGEDGTWVQAWVLIPNQTKPD